MKKRTLPWLLALPLSFIGINPTTAQTPNLENLVKTKTVERSAWWKYNLPKELPEIKITTGFDGGARNAGDRDAYELKPNEKGEKLIYFNGQALGIFINPRRNRTKRIPRKGGQNYRTPKIRKFLHRRQ
jgi:hypothetical protein